MIPLEELAAIGARAQAAQTGPWRADTMADCDGWPCVFTAGDDGQGRRWVVQTDGVHASETNGATAKDDAVFVAAARQDVPRLLGEVLRLREELASLLATCCDGAEHGFHPERFAIAMDRAHKALGGAEHFHHWGEINKKVAGAAKRAGRGGTDAPPS